MEWPRLSFNNIFLIVEDGKIYQGHIKLLEGLFQSIKCDAKVMVEFIRKAKKSVINRTPCLNLAVLLPSVVFND